MSEAAATDERTCLNEALSRALDRLWIAFQPIVDWPTQRVFGYEALVRCNEPGLANPGLLFDAAEKLQRVHELGRAIRRQVACRLEEAPPEVLVFVNLHPVELDDEELLQAASPLTAYAPRIVLELTERSSLGDVCNVRDRIASLRKLGFRIAIDDLGAGYSGLSSVGEVEPDGVKLDMSLVRDVHTSATKRAILRSMIRVGHEIGGFVVCEGVETAAERDALLALGASLLQGYLFGRPEREFRCSLPVCT